MSLQAVVNKGLAENKTPEEQKLCRTPSESCEVVSEFEIQEMHKVVLQNPDNKNLNALRNILMRLLHREVKITDSARRFLPHFKQFCPSAAKTVISHSLHCVVDAATPSLHTNLHAGCLIKIGSDMVLVRHDDLDWSPPGGTYEERDKISQCTAGRETYEEVGVIPIVGKEAHNFGAFVLYYCELSLSDQLEVFSKVPYQTEKGVTDVTLRNPDKLKRDQLRFPDDLEALRKAARR